MLAKFFQYKKFPEYDSKVLQHNILMHIGDGAMYAFAISFISVTTILPVFIQRMGGNAIAIGAVPVLWNLGVSFPQLFLGQQRSNEKFVKAPILLYSLIYRPTFLLAGLFIFFFLEYISPGFSIPLILFFILIIAVLGSIPGPRWVNLFSKTVPVKLRGRLLAVRQLLGSLLGVLAGSIIIVILSSISFPQNFAVLFFLCFIFMFASFYFLRKVNEPEEAPDEELVVAKIRRIERIKKVVKENKNLRSYLIADGLLLIALTSSSFFAVYAIKKFQLPTAYAGSFTIILMASTVLGNIIFGLLADIFGHKINLMIMAAVLLLANLSAIISINPLTYGGVFFFVALAQSLQGISRVAFVVEISGEKNRTLYASLLNSITAPALLFGIIAGILISIIGYPLVFLIYILISGFAVFWLYKKVDEPRQIAIEQSAIKNL
jgi:MFS family permease